jgi:hypothetical protein
MVGDAHARAAEIGCPQAARRFVGAYAGCLLVGVACGRLTTTLWMSAAPDCPGAPCMDRIRVLGCGELSDNAVVLVV